MTQQRFTMVVAVHLFLIHKEKILLARRFQTGYEDGKYSVPAGHVDGSESVVQAMLREAKEEIGVSITPADLQFAHVMNRRTDRESVDFFFICKNWSGDPIICEKDKCDDLQWFDLNNLPKNIIPYVRQAVNQYIDNIHFSEMGW